jgi:hypothetical protein
MRLDAHQCREASNNSRLHLSGHHRNTSGHSSEFKKIPTLLCRHGLGRQLVLVCDWLHSVGQNHFYVMLLINQG